MDQPNKSWVTGVGVSILAASWVFLPSAFNGLIGVFIVQGLAFFLSGSAGRRDLGQIVLLFGGIGVLFIAYKYPDTPFWPYLAILSANLGVIYIFGNRLFQNKPSVLQQIVLVGHGGPALSDRFVTFLKRQCMAWVAFGLTMAVASCVAMALEPSRPFVNTLLSVLTIMQVIWFVTSHNIAQKRYGRRERWQTTLSLILKRKIWRELEI